MRILTISDLHVDYSENQKWVNNLSRFDFQDDILILAGDITHHLDKLVYNLGVLRATFKEVVFVTGNHDIWINKGENFSTSVDKFQHILHLAKEEGVHTQPLFLENVNIIPLFSWYDYSFGQPSQDIQERWMDFVACKWEKGATEAKTNQFFLNLNKPHLQEKQKFTISFSHFLPRIDILPDYLPANVQAIFPVFGSQKLENQIRIIKSNIHIYGHHHLNLQETKKGISYINNALGYPSESRICRKQLLHIF